MSPTPCEDTDPDRAQGWGPEELSPDTLVLRHRVAGHGVCRLPAWDLLCRWDPVSVSALDQVGDPGVVLRAPLREGPSPSTEPVAPLLKSVAVTGQVALGTDS